MFSIYSTGLRVPRGGNPGFEVLRDKSGMMEGSEWEIPQSAAIAAQFAKINTHGSITGAPTITAAKAVAQLQFAHIIASSLQMILMKGEGDVYIYYKDAGWIWTDADVGEFQMRRHDVHLKGPEMLHWLGKGPMSTLGIMGEVAKSFAAMSFASLPSGAFRMHIDVQID